MLTLQITDNYSNYDAFGERSGQTVGNGSKNAILNVKIHRQNVVVTPIIILKKKQAFISNLKHAQAMYNYHHNLKLSSYCKSI